MNNYKLTVLNIINELCAEFKIDLIFNDNIGGLNKKIEQIKKYSIFVRKNLYTIQFYLLENNDDLSFKKYFLIRDLLKFLASIQDLYTEFLVNSTVDFDCGEVLNNINEVNDVIKVLELNSN